MMFKMLFSYPLDHYYYYYCKSERILLIDCASVRYSINNWMRNIDTNQTVHHPEEIFLILVKVKGCFEYELN